MASQVEPTQQDFPAKRVMHKSSSELFPSLYQINTRVMMQELGTDLGRPATLDDVRDEDLDNLARLDFDWLWFLGVWQTGAEGRRISRENQQWQREYRELLPDFADGDVCGSCFAITRYQTHVDFGGDAALDRLRDRIHARGMKLLLDFVPNHTALDHEWVKSHPEYYVRGTQEKLSSEPQNYIRLGDGGASVIFAHGRDPYFDGWPDTLQLNYADSSLQQAMIGELNKIAIHCDGVRCDMAMLILPDVFERTWGNKPASFWPSAIQSVQANHPNFLLMAEVYWDLEWTLQQQGFSYTYDKRLYDRLREGHAGPVRDHFRADMDFQFKSARFLENHDEPRAAAVFPLERHRAAAVLSYMCPGLRFFHDGQFEGRRMKVPVHLCRRPDEPVDSDLLEFYENLLACVNLPIFRNGEWFLLDNSAAWEGNWTSDCFVCFAWASQSGDKMLVIVNFAPNRSQCYLRLPFWGLEKQAARLQDLMGPYTYDRDGTQLSERGLYLDLPAWGYHVFRVIVT